MAGLFRVVIKGWQERIAELPWHPVGWFAAQVVPSPTRQDRTREWLRLNDNGLQERPTEIDLRLAEAQTKRVIFSGPRRLSELLRLPPLAGPERVLAMGGIGQAYALLWTLVHGREGMGQAYADLGLGTVPPEPRLLLRRHVAIVGAHPGGGVEFVADLAGLPQVSAIFGISQGWLRPCRRCHRMFTPMQKDAFLRRVCDACKGRLPAGYYATGLSEVAQKVWQRARKCIYMRLRNRISNNQVQKAAYKQWHDAALADLRRCAKGARADPLREILNAWWNRHVPAVPRGRPHKHTDGGDEQRREAARPR